MIKILLIAGDMGVGGIENQLMHLLRKADKTKYQIDFTVTTEGAYYQEEIASLGGKCLFIRGTDGHHFLRYCCNLYRILKDGDYDVVHSHELFHSGLVMLTARLAGVKGRFAHAHNWTDMNSLTAKRPLKRTVYNAVMRFLIDCNATDFCACSTLAGKFLYGEKVTKQQNYHLIFNSVDTAKFLDRYEQQESGEFCADGWTNVLHVGRFCPQKNQPFLVELAREFRNRGKRVRILCAGDYDNPYGQQVKEQLEKEGLQDYMLLLGNRSDVDVLLRKSKAFVLPSQYEGMPLVLIEAQASGIPCVSADTFSHEVDFHTGNLQWLPITASAAQWADAVERACSSPRTEKAAVVAAVKQYGFDSQSFAERLCALYAGRIQK